MKQDFFEEFHDCHHMGCTWLLLFEVTYLVPCLPKEPFM